MNVKGQAAIVTGGASGLGGATASALAAAGAKVAIFDLQEELGEKKAKEIGGLFGRFVFAAVAVWIVSRRTLLRVFQIPSLIFVPLLFWWISTSLSNADSLLWIKVGVFIAGFLTIAQFSFWGNYIPLVFPLHLRGTGESFAANIGGRVLGTAAAWLTLTFSAATPPSPAKIAIVGACVAGGYILIGAILTQWLPEPKAEELKD